MRALIQAAIALLIVLAAAPAQAACSLCVCLAGTQAISFGTYNPNSSSPTDSTGEVDLTCTTAALSNQTLAYSIELNAGSGSIADRELRNLLAGKLYYNLYTANNHSVIWGDGSGSSQPVAGGGTVAVGQVLSRSHTIYGRIPGQQNVPAGLYSDTITVTVVY